MKGPVGPMELNIPAIEGIGGSNLYLVDRYGAQEIYDVDFVPIPGAAEAAAANAKGLTYLDHLTHNVQRGNMAKWADFYERIFNFREIRYFDIEGKQTGAGLQGHDQPVRQDPHPAEREPGRALADRGVPARTTRARASSTWRWGPATSTTSVETMRDARRASSRTPSTPTSTASTPACPATARTSSACRPTRS